MTDDGPAWRRVFDDLRHSIESGEVPVGQPLPSVPTLMDKHGVSNGTVQRAVEELRRLGMVGETRQGARTVVASAEAKETHRAIESLRADVADLQARVADLEQGRPD